jgi:hypothetical protein
MGSATISMPGALPMSFLMGFSRFFPITNRIFIPFLNLRRLPMVSSSMVLSVTRGSNCFGCSALL